MCLISCHIRTEGHTMLLCSSQHFLWCTLPSTPSHPPQHTLTPSLHTLTPSLAHPHPPQHTLTPPQHTLTLSQPLVTLLFPSTPSLLAVLGIEGLMVILFILLLNGGIELGVHIYMEAQRRRVGRGWVTVGKGKIRMTA